MNSKKFNGQSLPHFQQHHFSFSGIATVNAETYEVKSGDTLSKLH